MESQLLHPPLGRPVQARMITDHHQGVLGHIIQSRGHFRRNEGHVPVRGRQADAVFQSLQVLFQGADQALILILPPFLPGQQRLQVPLQPWNTPGMEARLALRHRQHCDFLHILRPTLGVGVEVAHGIQLVSKELHPDRLPLRRGKQVQDSPPEGKLAGPLHHGGAAVAHGHQAGQQLLHRNLNPQTQLKGGGKQGALGHSPEAHGLPGENLEPGLAFSQIV